MSISYSLLRTSLYSIGILISDHKNNPHEHEHVSELIQPTVDLDHFSTTSEEAASIEADAELSANDAQAVLEKYDKESAFRDKLPNRLTLLISVILIAFAVFQLYTTIFTIPVQKLRPIHLSFVMVAVYLLYPAKRSLRRDRIPWYDWVLAGLALFCTLYLPFNYEYVIKNVGNFAPIDIAVGIVGILLLFEACRRVVGVPIMVIVTLFLAYIFFGHLIPGKYGIPQMSLKRVITHMYYTTNGVFGTPIGVSATFIFLFILFGAFLEKTGVGRHLSILPTPLQAGLWAARPRLP